MSKLQDLKQEITTYRGLDCVGCEFVESCHCGGCIATKGRPFHVSADQEACEVAKCAMERGVTFCGECESFPCELLQSFSNDPEHGDKPQGARIRRCRELMAALEREMGGAL